MSDRKLIRPSMNEMMEKFPTRSTGRRKQVPAEQTNAESFYYLKQMQNRTAMVVVLTDGTELKGWIEWYDKNCLKLNRVDARMGAARFSMRKRAIFVQGQGRQGFARRRTPVRRTRKSAA